MFNAIRKGLMAAGRSTSKAGIGLIGNSALSGYGGAALAAAGRGMTGMSKMSNVGLSAAMGAVAGGAYGAVSDNTSVLGGALMGAGLGAGGYAASRLGRVGYGAFKYGSGSLGQRAKNSLYAMGGMSRSYLGPRLRSNRAVNYFRGLGSK